MDALISGCDSPFTSEIIFFFNFYLFYLWLCWVFIAAHRLSLVAVSWPYSVDAALRLSCSTTCGVFPEP